MASTIRPPEVRPLRFSALVGMRVRRGRELGGDLVTLARDHRLWWVLVLAFVLVVISLALASAHAALPVVVYTLV